jgi:hypothetical protein
LAFLKRCKASGNPEVLFSECLRKFFNYAIGNIGGLEKLKIAAEGGHNLAKYAYGLIMLCSENNEFMNEGIKNITQLLSNHTHTLPSCNRLQQQSLISRDRQYFQLGS